MNEITGCMIVKNEDRFVWYAITSVLPFVDRLIIYDTGSSDSTVKIIKSVNSPKIEFSLKEKSSPFLMTSYRRLQSAGVKKGWLWLVDGDEVYPKETAKKVRDLMTEDNAGIIVHRYDLLGDVYHFQDESVGSYNQFGRVGHYVLRAVNKDKFAELEVIGDYPNEYFAQNGVSIKGEDRGRFVFVEERIFHAMYLKRSTLGANLNAVLNRKKFKVETGNEIPKDDLPEVFFAEKPDIVPGVLGGRGPVYDLAAKFITPVKKIKRKLMRS